MKTLIYYFNLVSNGFFHSLIPFSPTFFNRGGFCPIKRLIIFYLFNYFILSDLKSLMALCIKQVLYFFIPATSESFFYCFDSDCLHSEIKSIVCYFSDNDPMFFNCFHQPVLTKKVVNINLLPSAGH